MVYKCNSSKSLYDLKNTLIVIVNDSANPESNNIKIMYGPLAQQCMN